MSKFFSIHRHAMAAASVSHAALPPGNIANGKRPWLARLFGVSTARLSSCQVARSPLSRDGGCTTTFNRLIGKRWSSFVALFRPNFSINGSYAKKPTTSADYRSDLLVNAVPISRGVVRGPIPAMRQIVSPAGDAGPYTAHQIFAMVNFTFEAKTERDANVADPHRETRSGYFRSGYF